jgi:hypothetical protein
MCEGGRTSTRKGRGVKDVREPQVLRQKAFALT